METNIKEKRKGRRCVLDDLEERTEYHISDKIKMNNFKRDNKRSERYILI